MNAPIPFRDRISTKAAELLENLQSRKLGIAVLGPALNNADDSLGARKRRQIHDALKQDGHRPFFPEDLVAKGPKALPAERELLSRDTVDWVILLHTKQARGTFLEVGHFIEFPEIVGKTTVLYPLDLHEDDGLMTNTVRTFWSSPVLYTDHDLASCKVVAECRDLASNRLAASQWPPDYLPI